MALPTDTEMTRRAKAIAEREGRNNPVTYRKIKPSKRTDPAVHRAAVLDALKAAGPGTETELAKRIGKDRTTVNDALRRLVKDGAVITDGEKVGPNGGRPARVYKVNPNPTSWGKPAAAPKSSPPAEPEPKPNCRITPEPAAAPEPEVEIAVDVPGVELTLTEAVNKVGPVPGLPIGTLDPVVAAEPIPAGAEVEIRHVAGVYLDDPALTPGPALVLHRGRATAVDVALEQIPTAEQLARRFLDLLFARIEREGECDAHVYDRAERIIRDLREQELRVGVDVPELAA